MALYLLSAKYVSRGQGRSFAGATAYRSGEKLHCQYQNRTHDYSFRDDVLYKEILLPPNAPIEFRDRQTLCNAVEQAEDGSTRWESARTAREIIVALPRELKLVTNILLVREFVTECLVAEGMCADIAIHRGDNKKEKNIEGDHKKIPQHNPHAHILLTTRPIEQGRFSDRKNRDWDKKEFLKSLREKWAGYQNRMFERKGLEVRVSHLSYKDQGIDREPGIHLGPVISAIEMKKNVKTKFGDVNRAIEARNEERERETERHFERD